MYDFKLVNLDTDSVTVCKQDGTPFSSEEQEKLLNELNSLFPPQIHWEPDGTFDTVIVLKAKNYILFDGKKIKTKGSSLRDSKRELALREFLEAIISTIIYKKYDYLTIYEKYVKEILNITDIKRYCSKKTITSTVMQGARLNEIKIKDAIEGTEYKEGDKIWVYYDRDQNLRLVEQFNGKYDIKRLLGKLYKTSLIFANVIDKKIFINYSLKKNEKLLENFK